MLMRSKLFRLHHESSSFWQPAFLYKVSQNVKCKTTTWNVNWGFWSEWKNSEEVKGSLKNTESIIKHRGCPLKSMGVLLEQSAFRNLQNVHSDLQVYHDFSPCTLISKFVWNLKIGRLGSSPARVFTMYQGWGLTAAARVSSAARAFILYVITSLSCVSHMQLSNKVKQYANYKNWQSFYTFTLSWGSKDHSQADRYQNSNDRMQWSHKCHSAAPNCSASEWKQAYPRFHDFASNKWLVTLLEANVRQQVEQHCRNVSPETTSAVNKHWCHKLYLLFVTNSILVDAQTESRVGQKQRCNLLCPDLTPSELPKGLRPEEPRT